MGRKVKIYENSGKEQLCHTIVWGVDDGACVDISISTHVDE